MPLTTYWVSFVGTRHGEFIDAKTMKEAKAKFAKHEGVSPSSSYIKARKVKKATHY